MATDLIDALRGLRRGFNLAATATFAPSGFNVGHVLIMRELRRVGSATQIELSRAVALDPAATMRAIDTLEQRGWVQRTHGADDRRTKRVSLTAKAEEVRPQFEAMYRELLSFANGALTVSERKQFLEMAARLAAALEAAGGAASTEDVP